MRFFHKKAVILMVAVLTVFLLAGSVARGKYGFMFLDKALITLLAPIEYVTSKVGYSVRDASSSIGHLIAVYRENQALKAEMEQMRQNQLNVAEVMAENARLRALLDYKKGAPQFDFVTAAVIARDPSSWTTTIIINRGAVDGITKDMPVVTQQGLVGNVTKVFNNTASVQLILDPRSAVGALVQRTESRVAAIVEGSATNPLMPRMVNLARDADIVQSDKIITSGYGGIYPKGLLVGEVVDVVNEEGGLLKYAVLKPAVDFDKLEEVMVIVRSREPAPTVLPPQAAPTAPTPAVPGQTPAQKGAGR